MNEDTMSRHTNVIDRDEVPVDTSGMLHPDSGNIVEQSSSHSYWMLFRCVQWLDPTNNLVFILAQNHNRTSVCRISIADAMLIFFDKRTFCRHQHFFWVYGCHSCSFFSFFFSFAQNHFTWIEWHAWQLKKRKRHTERINVSTYEKSICQCDYSVMLFFPLLLNRKAERMQSETSQTMNRSTWLLVFLHLFSPLNDDRQETDCRLVTKLVASKSTCLQLTSSSAPPHPALSKASARPVLPASHFCWTVRTRRLVHGWQSQVLNRE